jgi:hypothetical protein
MAGPAEILTAPTVKAAAAQAKVSLGTAVRWRALPHFRAAYDAAVRDAFGRGVALVQAGAPKAARALLRALKAPKDIGRDRRCPGAARPWGQGRGRRGVRGEGRREEEIPS